MQFNQRYCLKVSLSFLCPVSQNMHRGIGTSKNCHSRNSSRWVLWVHVYHYPGFKNQFFIKCFFVCKPVCLQVRKEILRNSRKLRFFFFIKNVFFCPPPPPPPPSPQKKIFFFQLKMFFIYSEVECWKSEQSILRYTFSNFLYRLIQELSLANFAHYKISEAVVEWLHSYTSIQMKCQGGVIFVHASRLFYCPKRRIGYARCSLTGNRNYSAITKLTNTM